MQEKEDGRRDGARLWRGIDLKQKMTLERRNAM